MLFRTSLFMALVLFATETMADLSSKQAGKLIAQMAGLELPSGTVQVKKVTTLSRSSAEARAEIETAFRLVKNGRGSWRVADVRVGPSRWEEVETITAASEAGPGDCEGHDLHVRRAASSLNLRRARCLVANLLGVQSPFETVRIKEISPLSVALTRPEAVVIALVQVDVRFAADSGNGWHVTEVLLGNREWVNLQAVTDAINRRKHEKAQAELALIAKAVQAFYSDRGFYLTSDKHHVLIDFLCPRYLSRVIRFDPWHHAYQYQGGTDQFTLRSTGPDGKENTPDDIVLAGASPQSRSNSN